MEKVNEDCEPNYPEKGTENECSNGEKESRLIVEGVDKELEVELGLRELKINKSQINLEKTSIKLVSEQKAGENEIKLPENNQQEGVKEKADTGSQNAGMDLGKQARQVSDSTVVPVSQLRRSSRKVTPRFATLDEEKIYAIQVQQVRYNERVNEAKSSRFIQDHERTLTKQLNLTNGKSAVTAILERMGIGACELCAVNPGGPTYHEGKHENLYQSFVNHYVDPQKYPYPFGTGHDTSNQIVPEDTGPSTSSAPAPNANISETPIPSGSTSLNPDKPRLPFIPPEFFFRTPTIFQNRHPQNLTNNETVQEFSESPEEQHQRRLRKTRTPPQSKERASRSTTKAARSQSYSPPSKRRKQTGKKSEPNLRSARAGAVPSTSSASVTCNICHLVFKYPSKLVAHMVVHTGSQPYSCDMCGHRFTRKVSEIVSSEFQITTIDVNAY